MTHRERHVQAASQQARHSGRQCRKNDPCRSWAISAYTARMAELRGYQTLYLSDGGVAANPLGTRNLGFQHHGGRAH